MFQSDYPQPSPLFRSLGIQTRPPTRRRNVSNRSYPQSRNFAELLIDCEEDRVLRAVLVEMLRDMKRRQADISVAR